MSGNRSKSAFFEGRWVTLNADFRGKGASPTNHSWCQSSRQTDRQNYDSQDRPRICSRGKNGITYLFVYCICLVFCNAALKFFTHVTIMEIHQLTNFRQGSIYNFL